MSEKPKTRSHELSIEIDAPPEVVWKAISEAEGIMSWFAPEAKVEPGAGGRIWLSWGPGMEGWSLIEAWEPGRHLRTVESRDSVAACMNPERTYADGTPVRVAVEYLLEGRGGKTVLRLVHSGFGTGPGWDAEYEATGHGWVLFLRTLKLALERHAGKRARTAMVSVPLDCELPEAWDRLVGPEGLGAEGKLVGLGAGERFDLRASTGARFSGVLEIVGPAEAGARYAELAGTLDQLDGVLFWVTLVDDSKGQRAVGVSLTAWGVEAEALERVRGQFEALYRKLFQA
jgi:uncharacterized protein YndB with AHSA1/START domain